MQNRNVTLYSALIATLALCVEFAIFAKDVFALLNNADVYTAVGVGIGVYMLLPHFAFFLLACIFNWLGYGTKVKGFTLTAGILYCIALVFAINKVLFVILPLVLSFVGFAKQASYDNHPDPINNCDKSVTSTKDDGMVSELLITVGLILVIGVIVMVLITTSGQSDRKDSNVLDLSVSEEDLEKYKIDVDALMEQFPNGF